MSALWGINYQAWLAALVNSSDDAIVSKDLNGTITSWNGGAQKVFGYTAEDIVGRSILTLIPEERYPEEIFILDSVKRGEGIRNYVTVRKRKDGTLIHVSLTVSPIYGDDKTIIGVSKIARDITEQVLAQETQTLLLRELNHRSKNLLAVADAIVRQTAKSTPARELVNRISSRLQALSINQDLMVNHQWRGASVAQVIRGQIEAVVRNHENRVSVDGPHLVVNPRVSQALGLAIYELASNASKYGALTTPEGRVAIDWSLDGEPGQRQFHIGWKESSGPRIQRPRKRGFGTTIIERMVAQSMLGKAELHYFPDGFQWTLSAPENALTEHEGATIIASRTVPPAKE